MVHIVYHILYIKKIWLSNLLSNSKNDPLYDPDWSTCQLSSPRSYGQLYEYFSLLPKIARISFSSPGLPLNHFWELIFKCDVKNGLKSWLTVTVQADSRLPKSSKMLIMAEMSTIAQKYLKRPPSEIQRRIFWYNKIFPKKIFFEGNVTGNEPEIDQKHDIFRPRIEFFGH